MNKFFSCLATSLIVLGSTFNGLAQDGNSLLWKVSGQGITKPSYLFGTIHMVPSDKYFFTDKMQQAFSNSEVLGLEAEMDMSLADQIKMAQQLIMPDGKSWSDFLSEEDYTLVKSAFVDSLGIKEKKFDKQYTKIKPFFVGALALTELLGKVTAYENELSDMANKGKKEIIGLETMQQQMDMVLDIPIEDQMEGLIETTAAALREYNQLLDAYLAQDLEALGKIAQESEEFDKIEAKLLTERNNKWVKIIQEKMSTHSTFFAVGALHLVGENGLIRKLNAAGYTVEAVN
jgi:hypothetical protein